MIEMVEMRVRIGLASYPRSQEAIFNGQPFAVMTTEDFITRNARAIAALWKTSAQAAAKSYGVTKREFAERLAIIALRANKHKGAIDSTETDDDEGAADTFLSNIKVNDLCMAIACERGDEVAWRKFESEYRHSMQATARSLTKDDLEAEDLIQFVFGELYGVRMDGEKRLGKLSHYSGRGSLGGWLRAVIYQCFIDRKRQTSRFEQVEEVEEFDRLAHAASVHLNGSLSAPINQPDDIEDIRLRQATEEAITEAFAELDPRDRLLLNYYYFDDLTLREIGSLMCVHEATISRWLGRAQREVKRKTEEVLQRSYGLRRSEVTECLQIAARTELDVRKLLSDVKST